MFNKLFKKEKVDKENNDICIHQSNLEECNLIKLLKEKQKLKKDIDDKIKEYESVGQHIEVQHIEKFFISLDENEFYIYMHDNHFWSKRDIRYDWVTHSAWINRFKRIVSDLSMEDIEMIFNELKVIKNNATTLEEMKSKTQILQNEIDEIKNKLGIM